MSVPDIPHAWALDLDGVVWLADQPLAGAAGAVHRLVDEGHRVLLVTNNSSATSATYRAKLQAHGLPEVELISSATAAATLVEPGERVLVCAGPGVAEAVRERGAEPVDRGPADAVMVGFHREFDFERLRRAATAVRKGARLIGTNDDATYPTPEGPIPGGGALLAAVEKASGVRAVVAGKPYEPICALVRGRLGPSGIMVGDRPETDGAFAVALGYPFALVLTGVTALVDVPALDPAPDIVAADLATLVDRLLGPAPRTPPVT
jgi:HAD superfamily hydrolase (TIGR01450 family)